MGVEFTDNEDQYFKYVDNYVDNIDLNLCDFSSFLNLLLKNKSPLNEIFHLTIKEKNFSFFLLKKNLLVLC